MLFLFSPDAERLAPYGMIAERLTPYVFLMLCKQALDFARGPVRVGHGIGNILRPLSASRKVNALDLRFDGPEFSVGLCQKAVLIGGDPQLGREILRFPLGDDR